MQRGLVATCVHTGLPLSRQNHLPVTRLHLTLSLAPSCHTSQSHSVLGTFLSPVSVSLCPWHLPVTRLHLTLSLAPSCHLSSPHSVHGTFLSPVSVSLCPWHLPVTRLNTISFCPRHLPVTRLNLTLSLAPSCHLSQSHSVFGTFLSPISVSLCPWHLPVTRLNLTLPSAPSCQPFPLHPALGTFLSPCLYGLNLISYLTVYQLLYDSVIVLYCIICSLLLIRKGQCGQQN